MDALLDSIRIAVNDGASDDERRRGLIACRAVADALAGALAFDDAPAGDVVTDATSPAIGEPPTSEAVARAPLATAPPPTNPFAAQLTTNPFAGMTPDQILELTIARLRTAVGDDAPAASAALPFRLTLVPIPRIP